MVRVFLVGWGRAIGIPYPYPIHCHPYTSVYSGLPLILDMDSSNGENPKMCDKVVDLILSLIKHIERHEKKNLPLRKVKNKHRNLTLFLIIIIIVMVIYH